MRLSDIKSLPLNHTKRTRVGRGAGSGKGKTSGRGHKGAKSRSGYHQIPGREGGQMSLFRMLPKRGFSNARFADATAAVNLDALKGRFEAGEDVTPETLLAKRVLRRKGVAVRILGRGDVDVALKVRAHHVTASARRKIEAAGGEVTIL